MGWLIVIMMLAALTSTLVLVLLLLRRGVAALHSHAANHVPDRPPAATIMRDNTEEARAIQDEIWREMEAMRGRR